MRTVVMRFGHALLVAVGVMEVTGWWGELITSMQSLITGVQLPL
ncbi:hypothetical protein [Streptomyces canus]